MYGNQTTIQTEDPSEILCELLGLAERRLEALGVRAVRLRGRLAHRAAAGVGRRRRPDDPRVRAGDRGRDRRQRTAGRVRSVRGRDRGRPRVRPEPGLRRRRAARPDQLPQLRQPGEAERRLAARPRGARSGRRLPRSARAGGRRQRLALQRDRARADLPDARRGDGRRAARGRGRCPGSLRTRATGWCWSGPSRPPSPGPSWPSSAASSTPGLPQVPLDEVDSGARARARARPQRGWSAPRTTSATADSPARSPRWRSPAGIGLWSRPRPAGGAARRLRRDEPVRRGSGRDRARAPAERGDELLGRAEAAGVEAVELGTVAGDRITIAAAERDVSVALADAERAWRSPRRAALIRGQPLRVGSVRVWRERCRCARPHRREGSSAAILRAAGRPPGAAGARQRELRLLGQQRAQATIGRAKINGAGDQQRLHRRPPIFTASRPTRSTSTGRRGMRPRARSAGRT